MQEHGSDAYAFLVVMCLPLVGWLLARPPVWRRLRVRLEPAAVWVWRQVVLPDPPDEAVLRRWATIRLEELRRHLDRVQRLILDDEWMTATRQMANRMAREHLVRDVREAEAALSAFGPLEPLTAPAGPSPLATSRLVYSAPAARPVVEVMEFGPSGRWTS
ncbi:hypothetical protein GCM10022197_24390 [Microlunatus spumicola]|uniref:Uncharacterized protein n=1 Tax=Microlunatus spumicola TaxID=81499 RepID=A0ABP6XI10_9ACTN